MIIPIKNIYYLLCYAWNTLEEQEKTKVKAEDCNDLLELLAKVLINGITYLFKRGIDRQYVLFDNELSGIKGKINFNNTIKKNLHIQSKTWCEFDELSHNVLHNQILKATLFKLLNSKLLDKEVNKHLIEIYTRFYDVDLIKLQSNVFHQIRLNRNNQYYKFLLNICQFIYENLLMNENSGEYTFSDFERNQKKMANLFENFVRNFYDRTQNLYEISAKKIEWDFTTINDASKGLLPEMRTDITLESKDRKIIIDTKYYVEALKGQYGDKIISNHLYQIYAYVKNLESVYNINKTNEACDGILLYPTVNYPLNEVFISGKHRISIRTIDLGEDPNMINENLLEIIGIKKV